MKLPNSRSGRFHRHLRPAIAGALACTFATAAVADDVNFDRIAVPATINADVQFTVQAVVSNDADLFTDSWSITVRSSADSTYDTSDDLLCTHNVSGGMGAQQIANRFFQCVYPASASGDYLVAYVDVGIDPNTANNSTFQGPLVINGASSGSPDLTTANLSAPANAQPGDTLSISYDVRNNGDAGAGATTSEVRLSTDTTFDGGDPLLCDANVSALAASSQTTVTPTGCRIPAATPGGNYRILVRADAGGAESESNETNNDAQSNLQVQVTSAQPDLVVDQVSAPITARAGDTLNLMGRVANDGDDDATSSLLGFRLSTDEVWESSDPLLCSEGTGPLPATDRTTLSPSGCDVPGGTADGAYFLLAKADATDQIAESDEQNNVWSQSLQIGGPSTGPDLVLRSITAPPNALPSEVVSVGWELANDGDGPSGNVTIRFRLAGNNSYSVSDPPLCDATVAALTPGATDNGQIANCVVPAGAQAGSAWIAARIDDDETLDETNEANNSATSAITINSTSSGGDLPDLQIASVSPLDPVVPGDSFNIPYTIANEGTEPASASITRAYLSDDAGWEPEDVEICAEAVNSVGEAAEATRTLRGCSIDASTAFGDWIIIVQADSQDDVEELNENNNRGAVALVVRDPNEPLDTDHTDATSNSETDGETGSDSPSDTVRRDEEYDGGFGCQCNQGTPPPWWLALGFALPLIRRRTR